jgi:hypothetical protein
LAQFILLNHFSHRPDKGKLVTQEMAEAFQAQHRLKVYLDDNR